MRGSVSPNMYITLVNMMMRFLIAVVFNFIITYLVLPDNVYRIKKKNPKDRSLISSSITITEQVETLPKIKIKILSRWKPYQK